MADSLAARRAVREHLETNFDEYLSRVSTYLRQTYPDLQLSTEVSEEIAATVIVRVSHANAEPDDIEEALLESAHEVIRARRPRLAQAKRLDEVGGPLRSDRSRALPSLRLVQSLGRAQSSASNSNGETSANASNSRLVLANPPLDLEASLFDHDSGTEPASDATAAAAPRVPRNDTGEPLEADAKGTTRALPADAEFEVSYLGEREVIAATDDYTTPPSSPRRESGSKHDASRPAPNAERLWEEDTDAFWDDSDVAPKPRQSEPAEAKPLGSSIASDERVDATRSALRTAMPSDVPHALFAEPSASTAPSLGERAFTTHQSEDAEAVLGSGAPSSVPPTRESMRPVPTPEQAEITVDASQPPPRTRRKTPRAKKPGAKKPSAKKPSAKTPSDKTARAQTASAKAASTKATRATPRTPSKRSKRTRSSSRHAQAAPSERLPTASASSSVFVADDLAVLSMLGFPSNPRRAALLCVTAVSEELGLEANVDLSVYVAQVLAALEELRTKLDRTSPMPPDAHLQWQRVARQATLRAFLAARSAV